MTAAQPTSPSGAPAPRRRAGARAAVPITLAMGVALLGACGGGTTAADPGASAPKDSTSSTTQVTAPVASTPVGVYTHAKEGTITLSEGGQGSWAQEGNDPFAFTWTGDAGAIVVSAKGKKKGTMRLAPDGNLVVPPDMISGKVDVTFNRQ